LIWLDDAAAIFPWHVNLDYMLAFGLTQLPLQAVSLEGISSR